MKDDVADDRGGLDSMEDLEEDTGNSETRNPGLEEIIDDLNRIGDLEVGIFCGLVCHIWSQPKGRIW